MVEDRGPRRPPIRPLIPVPVQDEPSPTESSDSEAEDFPGSVIHNIQPRTATEESEVNRRMKEQQRMDANVEAFEKKLSDFERMFIFISDELDFKQLSQMAEEIERQKERSLLNQAQAESDDEGQTRTKSRKLIVRDLYGFIQDKTQSCDNQEEGDDFNQKLIDRRCENGVNHPVRHHKQEKLCQASTEVTEFGHFVKGSLKVGSTKNCKDEEEKESEERSSSFEDSKFRSTLTTMQVQRTIKMHEAEAEVDRRRCSKWFDMLEALKNNGKPHSKLKTRARKGIPDSIRGIAWPILAGADDIIPIAYKEGGKQEWMRDLLRQKLDRRQLVQIFNDIPRTQITHIFFVEQQGTGQKALFAVLKCLAIYSPSSGYVQGMNALCGTLMTYTTPEDTFAITVSLFQNYQLQECFLPGLPGLEKNFYILLCLQKKYLSRLFEKFKEIGFTPQMYGSRWFMTLFSDYFPIQIVVRILDIYLMEGRKILFRIALAIFKILEKDLIKATDLEIPLTLMKKFPVTCDLENLLKVAHKYTFSKTLLDQIEKEYLERPNEQILNVCKMM